jgi:tRNA U34 5-carboxymethylaminomethyl modifying GTPase MnmE/TrmE
MMIESRLFSDLCTDSPEFARLYRESQESATQPHCKEPRVMVCGLLKAGKSSLLNALTGHLAQEYFATGASRATTCVAELNLNGVIYVDTPGLDANADDDVEAWRGLASADQLVFVHSLRIASLDTQEVNFLVELLRREPDLQQRLVVALTHAESAEDAKESRLAVLRDCLETTLGFCPTLITTSFTRHRRGMLENKPALLALSGVGQLHQRLAEMRAADLQGLRLARDALRRHQLAGLLDKAISKRMQLLKSLQADRTKGFSRLQDDLSAFVNHLRARLNTWA